MVLPAMSFKRPWEVLDGSLERPKAVAAFHTHDTYGRNRTATTEFQSDPSGTTGYRIASASNTVSSFQKSQLPRHTDTTPIPQPHLLTPSSTVTTADVLQRLANYACISLILPLRNYIKFLLLWRLWLPGLVHLALYLLSRFTSFQWITRLQIFLYHQFLFPHSHSTASFSRWIFLS